MVFIRHNKGSFGLKGHVISDPFIKILSVGFKFERPVELTILAPHVKLIDRNNRNINNIYKIPSRNIYVFPFRIDLDGKVTISIKHMILKKQRISQRQSLILRVWVSKKPNDSEIFFRFHPKLDENTSHLFFNHNGNPIPPVPKKEGPFRNLYSHILYENKDNLVPLIPDVYYYNVLNMENHENKFMLEFDETTRF